MVVNSFSQVSITGKVIDKETNKPLSKSHILNFTDIQGISADDNGLFDIDISVNDTIMITHIGYKTLQIIVSEELIGSKTISGVLEFYMDRKVEEIDEVVLRSHNLIGVLGIDGKSSFSPKKTNRIHINGLKQTYEMKKAPTIYGFKIPKALEEKKRRNQLYKIAELEKAEKQAERFIGKFDREYMMKYLKVTDEKFREILDYCNYNKYFKINPSELQAIEALLDCYDMYIDYKESI